MVVAFHAATLATERALPLTRTGHSNGSPYNDTIVAGNNPGTYDGLGGSNMLSFANALNGVVLDLAWQVGLNGDATDTLRNFTNVVGSNFDDAISPNDIFGQGDATLDGGDGNNTISFYGARQGVTVDLSTGTATDGSATDTLRILTTPMVPALPT